MIINLKYHIASLVAVFLALAIGILIGTTLLGNDTLAKSQDTLIKNLKKDYDKINSENKDSQAIIKKQQAINNDLQEYEKKTLPLLLNNKLQDRRIAIVETNTFGFRDDLLNTLTKISGATLTSDTKILNGINIPDQAKRDKIAGDFNLPVKNNDDFTREVARQIIQYILTGKNKNLIDQLEKDDIIKTSGNYDTPVSAVIFIGGSADDKTSKADLIDLPMINYLNEQKIPVYGVEHSDVAISYIKDYQKTKITTIDDIDLIPGQVALVWCIERQITGDFGIKNTAKQLLPNNQ